MNRLARFALSMTILTVAACGSAALETAPAPTTTPQVTLTISGSGGTSAVLKFLADAYRQQHNDLAFNFLSGSGSGGGVKGVVEGQFDLGAMSRLPNDSELAGGIEYLGFGNDKVVVATSPDLAITGLTRQQAKDIFLGAITNWSAVGGPDAPISILVREEEESSTLILREGIFGNGAFAAGTVVITSEGDMKKTLPKATNTIGYLAYSGVRLDNVPVHVLALDGQDPADIGGAYPYIRPLGVVYLPAQAAKAQPFLDFITGPEAQALLAGQGIAPAR